MHRIRAFFRVYLDELLYKVQWPKFSELQSHTFTVLLSSLLLALMIGLMDLVFRNVLGLIYN